MNFYKNWYKRYRIECHLIRPSLTIFYFNIFKYFPTFYVINIALTTCELKAELPPFNFGS